MEFVNEVRTLLTTLLFSSKEFVNVSLILQTDRLSLAKTSVSLSGRFHQEVLSVFIEADWLNVGSFIDVWSRSSCSIWPRIVGQFSDQKQSGTL